MSTCSQKPAIEDPGETLNTSGTTPATIPGSVFDFGRTRLLTGKSSTTSELSAHHPRTKSAHAAVMTEVRGTFHTRDNSSTRRRTPGSNRTGAEGQYGSRSPAAWGNR